MAQFLSLSQKSPHLANDIQHILLLGKHFVSLFLPGVDPRSSRDFVAYTILIFNAFDDVCNFGLARLNSA